MGISDIPNEPHDFLIGIIERPIETNERGRVRVNGVSYFAEYYSDSCTHFKVGDKVKICARRGTTTLLVCSLWKL